MSETLGRYYKQNFVRNLRKESNYNAEKFHFLALSATEEKEESITRNDFTNEFLNNHQINWVTKSDIKKLINSDTILFQSFN